MWLKFKFLYSFNFGAETYYAEFYNRYRDILTHQQVWVLSAAYCFCNGGFPYRRIDNKLVPNYVYNDTNNFKVISARATRTPLCPSATARRAREASATYLASVTLNSVEEVCVSIIKVIFIQQLQNIDYSNVFIGVCISSIFLTDAKNYWHFLSGKDSANRQFK